MLVLWNAWHHKLFCVLKYAENEPQNAVLYVIFE